MKTAVLAMLALGTLLLAPFASATLIFTATLFGTNEVPPNGSTGVGSIEVFLHDDLNTLDVIEHFSGLTGPLTAAHIHCCVPATANAPVVLPFIGFPTGPGFYMHTFNLSTDLSVGISVSAFIAGLESNLAYANIHTSVFPGGEIRGQLALPVPEPATLALLGLDEDASLSDVTRAFRERASTMHPDRHVHALPSERRRDRGEDRQ